MNAKRYTAAAALAASLALTVPTAPALADGAASTRNIILGGAAATLLIVNHNRKVHQVYAEKDRRQAQTAQERDNAWAAYASEKNAYDNLAAANTELQKEVAYQHKIIVQQRQELAMSDRPLRTTQVARVPQRYRAPAKHVAFVRHAKSRVVKSNDVASVSYGWGQP
ncbi:MAG: hypothetical protein JO165_07665 [Candidatus Eremiobacteraeota bacterium]|nr:hypothetical protein [Candidatus Eremiobacteraeota bacterium]